MKNVTFAHDASDEVWHTSRAYGPWARHADAIGARAHVLRVHLFNRHVKAIAHSLWKFAKPPQNVSARRPVTRVMKLIDPRRSAIVRRYAADLADHNGNSDGYAQAELDLLCMGTHEHEARLSPAPLITSQPATGRVHTR